MTKSAMKEINPKDYVSTKMSRTFKNQLVATIMDKTFKSRKNRLAERKKELLLAAHEAALPEGFKALLARPEVKKEWFDTATGIEVREGELKIKHGPIVLEGGFLNSQALPKSSFSRYYSSRHLIFLNDLPDKLRSSIKRFVKAELALEKDEEELKRELQKIIFAANTTRQLITTWPEIVEHHQFAKTGESVTLPAVIPTKLNTMLSQMKKDAA